MTEQASATSTPARRRVPVLVVAAISLVAAACIPYWSPGDSASTLTLPPYALVYWDAASDDDAGETPERYEIDVDGTTVGTTDHPYTACLLTGLDPSTTYDIEVWATGNGDTSRDFSPAEDWVPSLSTSYTTGAQVDTGSTIACIPTTDTDGDRLPDAVETNTGTYLHHADTGTSPFLDDSDGDGIGDGDEVQGTQDGLDLPAMGASPLRKDLLLEFDWFDDNAEPGACGPHTHQPTAGSIARVTSAFADAPVTNVDGSTGVNLISDYGQGGPFTGGHQVADADGVIAGTVFGSDFQNIRAANFAANRNGYFHYTLLPHQYNTSSYSSGYAEFQGDDLIVSLYCYGSDNNVGNTIMHEVGHNLGLWHGGDGFTNYKWNYNSVMNYLYQFPGVDNDCVPGGDGVLDYSSGTRAPLDESALVETNGICGGVDVDWNLNSVINGGTVAYNINGDIDGNGTIDGDSILTTLTDHDDWSNLFFAGAAAGAEARQTVGRSTASPIGITEQVVPLSARD